MSIRLLAPTAVALLAACATADEPATAAGGPCNADAAMAHIGHAGTDAMVDAARRDAGARISRKISPGQAVTMDYRPDRLDVHVDANNIITKLSCG